MSTPESVSARDEGRDTRILLAYAVAVVVAGFALAAACAWDVYPALPPAHGTLAIRTGVLFDGTGGPPIEHAIVVIDADRIACAGASCRVPDGAPVIDATDLGALPGLVDLDMHVGADASMPLPLVMWDYARLSPHRRRALLESGVTTVRDLGNVTGTSLAQKRQLASGRLGGPRLFAVGPVFTAPRGIPASTDFGGTLWVIERITRQVDAPDPARDEVRGLAAEGFDGVAAVCDGGIVDRLPRLDPAVLRAAVEEAHARGRWASVTTGRVRDVRDAVLAGADTIERGPLYDGPLPADVVALLRTRRITYVPTLSAVEVFLGRVARNERPESIPPEVWETLRRMVHEQGPTGPLAPFFDTVRTAAAAGVRLGAGTGSGGGFEVPLARELELLVAAGLSPSAALLAATRDAAVALRAERDLGTLEPGKLADLVLVAGRPWERIEDVRAVRLVIQAGRVVVDRS
jgi:enamidase